MEHEPAITNLSNGTLFNFKDLSLSVTTHKVKLSSDGAITGEVDIETTRPATAHDLFYGRVNFLSLSGRESLCRYLGRQMNDTPWQEILEIVFRKTIHSTRRGENLIEITTEDEVAHIDFSVWPFLQTNQPTTLFGDGASGKSYLAMMLAVAVKMHWFDNPLGLRMPDEQPDNEVVWLDYETSQEDFTRRLKRFTSGMNLGYCSIIYRRCSHNISDEIDELSLLVNAHNPALIVIDSIGAACAGDLHGSEAPTMFFNSIRRMAGAKLLLFHTNKERELYGNRFFWNFSRHVWEVKKQQAEGDDRISVGLFHRKANETKLFEPIAFDMIFDEAAITTEVQRASIADIPDMVEKMNMRQKIQIALKHGALTMADLSEETGEKEASLAVTLNRHKKIFTRTEGNKWGLLVF